MKCRKVVRGRELPVTVDSQVSFAIQRDSMAGPVVYRRAE